MPDADQLSGDARVAPPRSGGRGGASSPAAAPSRHGPPAPEGRARLVPTPRRLLYFAVETRGRSCGQFTAFGHGSQTGRIALACR